MPWNDNSKPGPWGGPPSDNDDRSGSDKPSSGGQRPNSPWGSPGGERPQPKPDRPRKPRRPTVNRAAPDLTALGQRLRDGAGRFFRGPDGRLRPGAVAMVAGAAVGLWVLS